MFEKCGNEKYSSSEPENYFSCNLSMDAPVRDDVLCAYAFGAGIGPGLPHCSTISHAVHVEDDLSSESSPWTIAFVSAQNGPTL